MDHYTYIIYSSSKNIYYKGYTTNPEKRIAEHNEGLSRYTAKKGPWELVYLKKHPSKREALIEEKKLKKAGSEYLKWLILQNKTDQN